MSSETPVHFRVRCVAQGLLIEGRWEFESAGIKVVIAREAGQGYPSSVAQTRRNISSANLEYFHALEKKCLNSHPAPVADELGHRRLGKEMINPSLREFPEGFQNLVRTVQRDLKSYASQTVGVTNACA